MINILVYHSKNLNDVASYISLNKYNNNFDPFPFQMKSEDHCLEESSYLAARVVMEVGIGVAKWGLRAKVGK